MVENTYNARIKHKRDTSANWTSADPVLLSGEIIVVDTDNGVRTKTGDGTSKYTQLPFDDELIYSKIDTKLDKSGGTMTGDIDMGDHELKNIAAADIDSIKLNGVYLTATDDTATGTDRRVIISGTSGSDDAVTLGGVYAPIDDTDAANKLYADTRVVSNTYTSTLWSSDWSGSSAPYSQTITVDGISATDTPYITPVFSASNYIAVRQQQAWNSVGVAESSDGAITFTCLEKKPVVDIPLKIEVIRYSSATASDQSHAPEYISDAALAIAEKVKSVQTSDSIVFIAAADAHLDGADVYSTEGNSHACAAMKALRSSLTDIDFACFLGDYGISNSTTTLDEGRQHFTEINTGLDDALTGLPQFRTPGECDGLRNSMTVNDGWLSSSEIYSYVGKYNEGAAYGSTTEGYCYRDFEEKKLRVICLNTSELGENYDNVSFTQRLWLARTLRAVGLKTGWGVIILSHYPLDFSEAGTSSSASSVGNLLRQYVDGGSVKLSGMAISFKNANNAKIYATFHGHTHNFKTARLNDVQDTGNTEFNVLRIAVPNMCYYYNNDFQRHDGQGSESNGIEFGETVSYVKTSGTANDTAFVVNVVNPSESKIYSFCYGAGHDRETAIVADMYVLTVPSQDGSLVYNGQPQSPTWLNYDSTKMTIGGTYSAINAGDYTATFTPAEGYCWSDGSLAAKYVDWSINKAAGSLSISKTSIALDANTKSTTFTVTRAGDGAITVISSDTSVATVSVSGTTITVNSVNNTSGSATITVKVAAGTNYTAPASKTCSVTASFKPTASTSAASGVTYTNGLSGLDAATVTLFAEAISNNSAITNATSEVYIDYGSVHRKISVGDQVTLSLNGTDYNFDVIGFNHDTLTTATAYGSSTATGKAGITFQMHDLFTTYYPMNNSSTNSGGWKSCVMRTSTMATMKGYLPSAWQSAIKPVNKASGTGGGSSSGTETVSDSCFLLAEIEISGSTTYSVSGEGTQYAYYKAGNSKVKNKSGSASDWWERSPLSGSSSYFCRVISDGDAGRNYANVSNGVAFGFCV